MASIDDKRAFFANKEKFQNTLHKTFGNTEEFITIAIGSRIVEKIIGDMFFHSDDHGDVTQQRALKLFKRDSNDEMYKVTLKNPSHVSLAIDFIANGLSFRQVQETFDNLRKRKKIVSSLNREDVADIARVVCAVNFQAFSFLFNHASM